MGKSLIVGWRSFVETTFASDTRYHPLFAAGNVENGASAAFSDRPLRNAGTFSNIRINVTANGVTANSTFTLLDSQVATSLVATITNATTGYFEDTSNTADLIASDECSYKLTTGASGTSLDVQTVSVEFDSDSDMVTLAGCHASSDTVLGASETTFIPILGGRHANSTSSNRAFRITEANVTWQDLSCHVGSNSRSDDSTIKSNIEAADGNMVITFASSDFSIIKEDTSNSDSISASNDLALELETGAGTGTISFDAAYSSLVSTDDQWYTGLHGNRERYNDGQTNFLPLGGPINGEVTTESLTTADAPFDFTAEELTVNLIRNIGVDTTTVLRINGGDGNVTVNHNTTSGIVTDTSNTDSISSGDEINFKISSPVGGTDFDYQYVGIIGLASVPSTISDYRFRHRYFG